MGKRGWMVRCMVGDWGRGWGLAVVATRREIIHCCRYLLELDEQTRK